MLINNIKKEFQFDSTIINKLINIVGEDNVITDKEGIYAYAFDCAHVPFNQAGRVQFFASQYNAQ